MLSYDFTTHFEADSPVICRWKKGMVVTAVYYDGERKRYYVKRFCPEKTQRPDVFISQAKGSFLAYVSVDYLPQIKVSFAREKGKEKREDEIINLAEFIAVKGFKAMGNQLSSDKVKTITAMEPLPYEEVDEDDDDDEIIDEEIEDADVETTTMDENPYEEPTDVAPAAVEEDIPQGVVNDDGQVSLF